MELNEKNRTLTGLVHIADILASRLEDGFARGTETTEFDPALLLALDITQEHIDQVAQALPEAMDETKALFQSV